jgi:hypothetical protein
MSRLAGDPDHEGFAPNWKRGNGLYCLTEDYLLFYYRRSAGGSVSAYNFQCIPQCADGAGLEWSVPRPSAKATGFRCLSAKTLPAPRWF